MNQNSSENRINIIDFYSSAGEGRSHIASFIEGHLYIEFALNMITEKLTQEVENVDSMINNFFKKVKILRILQRITPEMEKCLLEINTTRNKLAHKLDMVLTYEKTVDLIKLSHRAGVEYSDDTILTGTASNHDYNIQDMILELFGNTYFKLLFMNQDLFPENSFLY